MTSLTKKKAAKGTRQEYEEELVHNALAIAWNAVVSMAWIVKDNILWVMTALVIAPESATPQTPVVNPPYALLRVPIALIIK